MLWPPQVKAGTRKRNSESERANDKSAFTAQPSEIVSILDILPGHNNHNFLFVSNFFPFPRHS